jgi:conjugative relaxase-like TrwC/TraI family protein
MVTGSDFMTALQATSYHERDNYYLKDGVTEKGQWLGLTAEFFGKSGDVDMKDFYEFANGIKAGALSKSEYKELRQLDVEAANLQTEFEKIDKLPPIKQAAAKIAYETRKEIHNHLRKSFNKRLAKEDKLIIDTTAKEKDGGLHMHHRAGYDLTFSAPKSASIIALVGGDKRLIDAHSEAVKRVMTYLEKHFSQGRVGSGKDRHMETTGNLLAAQFTHYTSRSAEGGAPDPQLHTHNFIFNMTKTSAGFASIDNKEMLLAIKLAGQLYQNEYAKIVKTLGYEIEWHKTGSNMTFELKGIDRDMIDHYSKRHNHLERLVEEKEKNMGRTMSKSEKIAFKRELVTKTRSAKEPQHMDKLEESWMSELSEQFGINVDQLKDLTKNQISDMPINHDLLAATIDSVAFNDDRKAVFSQHDLMLEMGKMSMGTSSLAEMYEKIITHSKQQLETATDTYYLGRAKNNSETMLYSSKDIIDAEARIIDKLEKGRDAWSAVNHDKYDELYSATKHKMQKTTAANGKEFYELTDGQFDALKHVMTNKDQIIGVQGDAGTGKTTMLKYLNEALGSEYDLVGISKTARAAKEITDASGIRSMTVDRFLSKDRYPTERKRILIVDESSMAGTKQIDKLLSLVKDNTKVVFIGDDKQLKAVEAGDYFNKLKNLGMESAEMTQSIRHKTEITKKVAELMKDVANVSKAFHALDEHGKLVNDEDNFSKKFVENVAKDYMEKGKENVLALVSTNAERRKYNEEIRKILRSNNAISTDDVTLGTLSAKRLNGSEKIFSGSYSVGDQVMSRKMQGDLKGGKFAEIVKVDKENNTVEIKYSTKNGQKTRTLSAHQLKDFDAYETVEKNFSIGDKIAFEANETTNFGFSNGDTAVIKNINKNGNMRVELSDGREVDFNFNEYKHIDHAYTMTTHKSQGQSVDYVHVLADAKNGMNNYNAAYVLLTRAIKDVHLYTNDLEKLLSKYEMYSTPDNAIDYLSTEKIKSLAQLDKLMEMSRIEADKQTTLASSKPYNREVNKQQIKIKVKKTREVQLYEMDKRLLEFGRIDLNKSYQHAVDNGYASEHYVKALHRMDKRLNQLVKKGFVTELKDGAYVFNRDKEEDFHRYKSSFMGAVDRADAAASWKDDFTKTYKKLNSKKAFVGRRYGRPTIQREINAGIDRLLNEAFASSVALVTATSKFAAMKIFKLGVEIVNNAIDRHDQNKHQKNKDPEFTKNLQSATKRPESQKQEVEKSLGKSQTREI